VKFGQIFTKRRLLLEPGGQFEFDAVSSDALIAVAISTCGGIATGGKKATPKLNKIRSDALFLLLAEVDRRVIVFSCAKMYALCEAEIRARRFPSRIEILLAQVPPELEAALVESRLVAAREVSPGISNATQPLCR